MVKSGFYSCLDPTEKMMAGFELCLKNQRKEKLLSHRMMSQKAANCTVNSHDIACVVERKRASCIVFTSSHVIQRKYQQLARVLQFPLTSSDQAVPF